jgi:hypothetical protein
MVNSVIHIGSPASATLSNLYYKKTKNIHVLLNTICNHGDDINFPSIHFPHLDSNIPTAPAYGVYISQLIHYAPACRYSDLLQRHRILSTKLSNQGFLKNSLILSVKRLSEVEKYPVRSV